MFTFLLVMYKYNHKAYMKENILSPKKVAIFLLQHSKFGSEVLTADNLIIITAFSVQERCSLPESGSNPDVPEIPWSLLS